RRPHRRLRLRPGNAGPCRPGRGLYPGRARRLGRACTQLEHRRGPGRPGTRRPAPGRWPAARGVPVLHRRGQGAQPGRGPGPATAPVRGLRPPVAAAARIADHPARSMRGCAPMSHALLSRDPVPVRHALVLLGVYALAWLLLAIDPLYREDWALENVLVLVAVAVLPAMWKRMPLSWPSCSGLFVFGLLHAVGAHYTYSEVPYDAFFQEHLGRSVDALFGFQRNTYDRLVHFCYGLLLVPTCVELLDRVAAPRGAWRHLLPVSFVMSHALLFELFEW